AQGALVWLEQLFRALNGLGVIPQQIADFSLSGAVGEQHELCPLHSPLPVGHMVAIDLREQIPHNLQIIPHFLNQPSYCNGGFRLADPL
ncbi:30S ribosomal protein S20, partial [Dysosmobacter welbionis]